MHDLAPHSLHSMNNHLLNVLPCLVDGVLPLVVGVLYRDVSQATKNILGSSVLQTSAQNFSAILQKELEQCAFILTFHIHVVDLSLIQSFTYRIKELEGDAELNGRKEEPVHQRGHRFRRVAVVSFNKSLKAQK